MTVESLIQFMKHERLSKGLSMRELAEKSDVRPATICDIENGKVQGGIKTVADIFRGLGYELELKKIQGQKN